MHRKSVPSEEVTALLAARKQMQITGAITRVDDAAVRTALHDVANAMLTRATKFSALKR